MTITTRRSAAASALAAVSVLALSSCGKGEADASLPPAPTSSSSSSSSSSTSSDATTSTTSSSPSGSVTSGANNQISFGDLTATPTPPGTKLKVGQPATLVLEEGKPGADTYAKAVYKFTITGVRKGDNADLQVFKNKDELAGVTPWYVDSTYEIVAWSGNKYAWPLLTYYGVTPDGRRAGKIDPLSSYPKCEIGKRPDPGPGVTGKTCQIGATKGTTDTVTGAQYQGSFNGPYQTSPLIWNG